MTKPGRWDRPPEPHDWRWAVAHIGRAMVTTGVLMFGFVAYQLWGTGLQTSRAQDRLQRDFENRVSALSVPADTIAVTTTTPSDQPPVGSTTDSTTGPPTVSTATTPATDSPTATTVAAPTGPVAQDYGPVRDGEGIGRLRIPRIGLTDYYVAGVGKSDLASAVGHFPRSVVPGQLGNAALAGHRTTHGAPFSDLDALQPGDEIDIQTVLGGAYVYVVTGSEVVDPSDYGIVTDSDASKATLTLITCTPKWSSTQRLVVHADLDTARSGSPVGIGQVFYGEAQPDSTLG
ncbi:MAG: peptidase family protein, partial [Ilumatobacteraceae bacterium]|nr:peptidase family protein [Ilumatobacteraceae bacterium]